MPLKKGDVKSSSKKPLKKGGVKSSSKKPLKKEGVKSSSKMPLKKGGGKDPIKPPPSESMQRLIHRLQHPKYPQDPDYVKPSPPSPLKDRRSMLSIIRNPQNQPLAIPQSALDHVYQTRGTVKTLLSRLKPQNK